ncbi:hypothetical protein Tco_0859896 [Tanacetum coccineum]|uniref:Uncharacterized protein n=1 Tax=Tanacetum coccineum TaxID=301880 RepID=A0ABQ5BHC0_9ASTR
MTVTVQMPSQILLTRSLDNPDGVVSNPDAVSTFWPYTPFTVIIPAVPATKNSPAVPERATVETILNMSFENKAHFETSEEAAYTRKRCAVQTSYMEKIQEVPTADSVTDSEPLEHVQYDTGYNVFANEIQYSEQSESISNTCVVETGDSNVILDSPDMCDNDIQNDQECE